MKFEPNIGAKNRILRLLLGLTFLFLALLPSFSYGKYLYYVLIAMSIILILEAVFAYCVVLGACRKKDMR